MQVEGPGKAERVEAQETACLGFHQEDAGPCSGSWFSTTWQASGPRCGGTAMGGKNKALLNDTLAKQTKPAANAGGWRMLFLRPWHKYLVEKKQRFCFPPHFIYPLEENICRF